MLTAEEALAAEEAEGLIWRASQRRAPASPRCGGGHAPACYPLRHAGQAAASRRRRGRRAGPRRPREPRERFESKIFAALATSRSTATTTGPHPALRLREGESLIMASARSRRALGRRKSDSHDASGHEASVRSHEPKLEPASEREDQRRRTSTCGGGPGDRPEGFASGGSRPDAMLDVEGIDVHRHAPRARPRARAGSPSEQGARRQALSRRRPKTGHRSVLLESSLTTQTAWWRALRGRPAQRRRVRQEPADNAGTGIVARADEARDGSKVQIRRSRARARRRQGQDGCLPATAVSGATEWIKGKRSTGPGDSTHARSSRARALHYLHGCRGCAMWRDPHAAASLFPSYLSAGSRPPDRPRTSFSRTHQSSHRPREEGSPVAPSILPFLTATRPHHPRDPGW